MRTWRSAVLVLGALAVHGVARAQPRDDLDGLLRVTASADGCVNEASLAPRVRRWLDAAAPQPELTVAVHGDGPKIAFTVERSGEVVAERRFDVLPADCGDRLDAIAVAIAVAIEHAIAARADEHGAAGAAGRAAGEPRTRDSERARSQAEGPQVTPQPAETAPAPEPEQTETAPAAAETQGAAVEPAGSVEEDDAGDGEDDAPRGATSAARLFASGGLLVEVLPEAAFVLGAGGELQRSALRLGVAGLFTPLESETALGAGTARSRLLALRAHACLGVPLSELDLEGCAGVAGGVVLAAGYGFPRDDDAAMVWLAGVLRAAVRYPESSSISLRLALDGLLSVLRPELETLAPTPAKSSPSPLGAAASLELVIALP